MRVRVGGEGEGWMTAGEAGPEAEVEAEEEEE